MDDTHQPRPAQELDSRYQLRRNLARQFGRRVHRVIVLKRVYLASFIGYAVFDPTVAAILVPVLISLIPVVVLQHHLVTQWARNRRSATYYAHALDRLSGRWSSYGDQGNRYRDNAHPYLRDLDIFGRRSLFQLLCRPCTAQGRDVLAKWLTAPGNVTEITRRQAAVQELRALVDVHEQLDTAGGSSPPIDTKTLRKAAEAKPILETRWVRYIACILTWLWLITGGIAWRQGGGWSTLFLSGLVMELVGYVVLRPRILVICSRGYQIGQSLVAHSIYAQVLSSTPWRSSMLRDLLQIVHRPPRPMHARTAAQVGVLAQIPLAYLLAVQLVPLIESRLLQRLRHFPDLWSAVGQFETLIAFATHAYEHPLDCFPAITDAGPRFHADRLGHPLIAEQESIRNDVHLDEHLQMLMVSGSNMSGKSTLLRTVGVNAALALAGATARASSLQISPLVIGAAIRFQDSLDEGTSYFYSVLTRLRCVLDLLQDERPLLFLLDEIMQGTNSHDRLVGAEAVIRKLLAADAIGLVTTHDLELTRVAEHLAPSVANVHFVDSVVAGKLHFDYRMREGVVQTSNAIRLMREMGLDV